MIASLIFMAAISGAPAMPDIVPLEFVGGIPFVKVTVGAAPQKRMMFDSGGKTGICVPQATISRAGSVKLLAEKERYSDLNGEVHEVAKLIAANVVVGKTRIGTVPGRVHAPWGGKSANQDLNLALHEGVIGLEPFVERPLMFDYKRGTMSIFPARLTVQPEWKTWRTLPLGYGKEGPYVTLQVAGKPRKFVLDTGAQVNIIGTGQLACAEECPRPRMPDLADVSGRPLVAQDAERMELPDVPFDGILGAPFFRSYRVVFDLKGGQLYFAPN